MKEILKISENDGVVRVDKFLAAKLPEYSRAAITKLFDLNLIKLNGESIQPGHKIRPGSEIEYDLGPLQEKPEVIPLPIIYEDDDVIVIDKPAGVISHARGKFWQEASVASFIRDKVSRNDERRTTNDEESLRDSDQNSKLKTQNSQPDRAGIVHRLDRATSGVMICAKNEKALKFLQKQFSDRSVEKTYVAVVNGALEHEKAIIDAPIERDLKDPKRFKISVSGKQALTEYAVTNSNEDYSIVELKPKTGRTHQLRLHLKHVKKPIVGDALYGGEQADRLMLHAKSLKIMLPSGEQKTFSSPLPKEFNEYEHADK